jgi:hypothetical protein
MVGVLVTQRLGIVGLPAIPVYLIAAGTTRQVIDQGHLSQMSCAELLQPSDIGSWKAPSQRAELYRIAHAVPGRVRFHIPRLAWDAAYARRAQQQVLAAEGVTDVRVSLAAASLAVTYRSRTVSDALMCSRLAQLIEQAAQVAEEKPPAPPAPPAPEAAPFAPSALATAAGTNGRKPQPPAPPAPPALPAPEAAPFAPSSLASAAETNGRKPQPPASPAPLAPPAPEAAPFAPSALARAAGTNGRKPLRQPEPAPPVPSELQPTERSRWLKSLAAETPAEAVAQKNSMWAQYKPPALSVFLAFMANLY